eukprot:COSAG01_NODE_1812_length_9179_cov_36.648789_12_plen_28_part_01
MAKGTIIIARALLGRARGRRRRRGGGAA